MDTNSTEIVYDVILRPGEPLTLPKEATHVVGPGHWLVSIRPYDEATPSAVRIHAAFLNSYAPEDEGLYDDYPAG